MALLSTDKEGSKPVALGRCVWMTPASSQPDQGEAMFSPAQDAVLGLQSCPTLNKWPSAGAAPQATPAPHRRPTGPHHCHLGPETSLLGGSRYFMDSLSVSGFVSSSLFPTICFSARPRG